MLVPFGFGDSTDALLPSELRAHMKALPVYITEQDGKRVNRAFNDLVKEETFWQEDKARKISLRSVHGRYLVRLLDKVRDTEASSLAPHGTRVRLKVRSTARLGSVVDIMRQWIVIPRCKVTVQIDDEAPVDVGFASAADVVADHLQQSGLSVIGDQPQYKVISRNVDGVEFAYAVRWSPAYRDWTIAHVNGRPQTLPAPCTCDDGGENEWTGTFGCASLNF